MERVHADEEHLLDIIPRNSQEAIVSCLSLQWINDLPGCDLRNLDILLLTHTNVGMLIQIKEALKPDGLFLGALLGGDTLFELR